MKHLYFIVVFLGLTAGAFAQPVWEVGAFAGLSNYQGDLVQSTLPIFKEGRPAFGVTGRFVYSYAWTVRGSLTYGKIGGSDTNYPDDPYRQRRNTRFESSLVELGAVVEWEPFGEWRYLSGRGFRKLVSPYAFTGLGLAIANPKVTYPSEITGSVAFQQAVERDKNADYLKTHPAIPIGVGVKFDFSEYWYGSFEVGMRYAFTDYLDGVSQTGNPNNKDWYQFAGVNIVHRLGNTEKLRRW